MPSGFLANGVTDLDDIFELRSGQTPISNTGFKVGGTQDLADRYAGAAVYMSSGSLSLTNNGTIVGSY